jgi:pyruvate carboxylase
MLDPDRAKYDLKYYVGAGQGTGAAGAHVLGLKDMAGLLKPAAARKLIETLKQEVGLPIHLHTHDTSGLRRQRPIMAAVEAGVDAVDAAMDALLGHHLAADARLARGGAARRRTRDPGLDGR